MLAHFLKSASRTVVLVFLFFIYCWPIFAGDFSQRPDFLGDKIIKNYYDGKKDDLLTAGWLYQEFQARQHHKNFPQANANTLRKMAYFNNTMALVDTTNSGGYGRLFGPAESHPPVSGYEFISYSVDEKGDLDTSLMLQIPDTFDRKKRCVIVAATSGSRGIYGAVSTVGTWALTNQCAIAYTDKGTGTGFYFFDTTSGYAIDGVYQKKSETNRLTYSETLNDNKQQFLKVFPTAVATKQAHSMENIERKFGEYVYQAAQFALYQLNQHFAGQDQFTPANSLIIAASISNGGVASLRAGEFDQNGLFDGIVASEPNIYPPKNHQLKIFKSGHQIPAHSIPGYDYFIAQNLYSPCALLTEQIQSSLASASIKQSNLQLENWCKQLKADGFITGKTISELAESSLSKLRMMGIDDNQQLLSPLMEAIKIWPSLAVTYTNQVGRYQFADNPCGIFFAASDPKDPMQTLSNEKRAFLFANSNGIPPTAGVNILSLDKTSSSYQQAKCFYQLSLTERTKQGVQEIVASAKLPDIPVIIIHGQNDNLVAPNHTSRPYYAAAIQNRQSTLNKIRYYEVTNAQHFDAFLTIPNFAQVYIPLHYYFEQSLDILMANLIHNKPLPPSQVIKTKTRALVDGNLEPLSADHLTPIQSTPENPIELKGNRLIIP